MTILAPSSVAIEVDRTTVAVGDAVLVRWRARHVVELAVTISDGRSLTVDASSGSGIVRVEMATTVRVRVSGWGRDGRVPEAEGPLVFVQAGAPAPDPARDTVRHPPGRYPLLAGPRPSSPREYPPPRTDAELPAPAGSVAGRPGGGDPVVDFLRRTRVPPRSSSSLFRRS